MSFTVEIQGLREVQARFDKLPGDIQAAVKGQIQAGAMLFVRNAQRDAPRDTGGLAQGITYSESILSKTQTSFEVVSNKEYSAYQEWGTITYAAAGVNWVTNLSQLKDLPSYAITFKGKGIRKTGGVFPHPFFFKQMPLVIKEIEIGIENELSRIKI